MQRRRTRRALNQAVQTPSRAGTAHVGFQNVASAPGTAGTVRGRGLLCGREPALGSPSATGPRHLQPRLVEIPGSRTHSSSARCRDGQPGSISRPCTQPWDGNFLKSPDRKRSGECQEKSRFWQDSVSLTFRPHRNGASIGLTDVHPGSCTQTVHGLNPAHRNFVWPMPVFSK